MVVSEPPGAVYRKTVPVGRIFVVLLAPSAYHVCFIVIFFALVQIFGPYPPFDIVAFEAARNLEVRLIRILVRALGAVRLICARRAVWKVAVVSFPAKTSRPVVIFPFEQDI